MRVFGAKETADLLPYGPLAESIRAVALAAREGRAKAPPRVRVPLPGGGALLIMPASDGELAITKLVTVHPGNAARGMPTVQGEVVALEAATGRRLGLLEGGALTARRTAALSLLAARELAPRPEGPLLIVGAGTQGRSHLEAFREGLGVRRAFIVSRTRQSARGLAEHAQSSLGMEARAVRSPEEALGEARLVVTATTSREPVLPGALHPETFVAAVGAYTPEMAELPPALVAGSSVFVDTLEGAREEAGDLLRAAGEGRFRWEEAGELADALRGDRPPPGRPVVFKSVGHALWDLAAARRALLR